MACFLKSLEMSHFRWRRFRRCAIHKLSLHKWYPESEDLFGLQLHSCSVLFGKLWRNFFCFRSFAHMQSTPRANLPMSVFRACKMHPKVALVSSGTKSFGYSQEKLERPCLFVCLFSQMTKSGALRGYPYFWNTLLIFMIFRNEYNRTIMVGMHVLYTDGTRGYDVLSYRKPVVFVGSVERDMTLTQVTGRTAGHGRCNGLGAVGRGAILGAALHSPSLTCTHGAGIWSELGPALVDVTLVKTLCNNTYTHTSETSHTHTPARTTLKHQIQISPLEPL